MRERLRAWMAKRTVWLLAGALLTGLASFWAAGNWLRARGAAVEQRIAGSYASERVLVAAREVMAGQPIERSMLAVRHVPRRYLAGDALSPAEARAILGARLVRSLHAGEVLTRSAMQAAGQATLSSLITPGQRAITIAVDELSSSAGLLVPGDRVDLLYIAAGGEGTEVQPLLQDVRVVATGSQVQRRQVRAADGGTREVDVEFGTVTLHVNALDAERIVLAQRAGELTAVLRHPDDATSVELRALNAAALLSARAATTAPRIAALARSLATRVEFIVGGHGEEPQIRNTSLDTRSQP